MKIARKNAMSKGEKIVLDERNALAQLLRDKRLYDMKDAAKIIGVHYRYLRRLCHAGTVDHHKLLGRYYMTPRQVADLLTPVPKVEVEE